MQQNPIRLKNLLGQAEEKLVAYGLRAPEARNLLEVAHPLVEDNLFWQHQSDGLALLLTSDLFRAYRLPLDFEEFVFVGDHFYLKPLLPLLSGDGRFYILALSQNQIRLWQASRHSIGEIELKNTPTSMAEALKYDDPEKQLQFQTATGPPGSGGHRPAMFHSHAVGSDVEKTNLLRYFQQVEQGVQAVLKNEAAPLVVASVEYLLPIYKEVNSYPHLLNQGITGNPEILRPAELHEQAWAWCNLNFSKRNKAP